MRAATITAAGTAVAADTRRIARRRGPRLRRRPPEEPPASASFAKPRTVAPLYDRVDDGTALFTDVAGFTALVETLAADRLADLPILYSRLTTDIVSAQDGTVAKLMRDAPHALFGAPALQEDHAGRAVVLDA